jgi:hypothetical protein
VKNKSNNATPSSTISKLSVVYRQSADLVPYSNNARVHTPHQVRQIANSIRTFGYTNPVLVDASDHIIAGHGRLLAAQLLGMEQVPTIRLESLTPAQIRAYILADNKIAENAAWDNSLLAIELHHLLIEEEIDVTITGFEIPEIDLLLEEAYASRFWRRWLAPSIASGLSTFTSPAMKSSRVSPLPSAPSPKAGR